MSKSYRQMWDEIAARRQSQRAERRQQRRNQWTCFWMRPIGHNWTFREYGRKYCTVCGKTVQVD